MERKSPVTIRRVIELVCETSVRGDISTNHVDGAGSIPASRSMNYQDMSSLTVEPIDKELAKRVVLDRHYSHKWNFAFGVQNYGIFHNSNLMGVAVYGNAMNRNSWSKIVDLDPSLCLELNRLWVDDSLQKNTETWFIAQTLKDLKKKGYRLIQSFADGRLGVGTVYQAANFDYYGRHKSLFYLDSVTNDFLHDKNFCDTNRPKAMIATNLLHAEQRLKTFEITTYRYLFPLAKDVPKRIKLKKLPYPERKNGMIELLSYKPPVTQIARAAVLARVLGDEVNHLLLIDYLVTLTEDWQKIIFEQEKNHFVLKLIDDYSEPKLF